MPGIVSTLRSLGAMAAAAMASVLLAAACASDSVVDPAPEGSGAASASALAPPSPSDSPSLEPPLTPRPTPSPTPRPTPSVAPSPSVSASPSATPSPAPPVGQLLFRDDFSNATSPLWGASAEPSGSVAYADGALRIDLSVARHSLWSWRAVEPEQRLEVVRTEGRVTTSGAGAAGWLCGSADDRFIGGLIHSSGEWVVVDITDSTSSALDRGPLPEGIDPALPHLLSVECSGTSAGAMRLRLLVDGQEAVTLERDTGIDSFDRVGAYAFADEVGYAATFDDAAVSGGDAPSAASPSPAGSPDPSP